MNQIGPLYSMKIKWSLKFLFLPFIFLFISFPIFSLGIFPKNTHLDFYLDKETQGEKLSLNGTMFCLYQTRDGLNQNFGFSWNAEPTFKHLPWLVKAGNITPVALYSKLKSPLLNTSVSPFGSVAGEAACVNVNLPSHTSFNRPSSYFLQCGYTDKTKFLRNVLFNYWNSPEETYEVISGKIKLAPLKSFSVAVSLCAGFFDYSDNSSNSWFMEEPYYHSGTHFCSASQMSFTAPHQKTLFTLGLYENPFGGYESVYRGETKIKSDHFIFNLAGAYVPWKCITSDDSTLTPQLQLKGGIQYHFVTGVHIPVFIKTGTTIYSKINLDETVAAETTAEGETVHKHPLKLGTGIQVSSAITSVSFVTTINGSAQVTDAGTVQLHFDDGGFTVKNTWYFQTFCPSISASQSFNPSKDYTSLSTTRSFELNYAFTGNPNISDKYKISFKEKNGITESQAFTNSVTCKTKIKKVSCTFKFEMQFDF